jgi:hypothetical protein
MIRYPAGSAIRTAGKSILRFRNRNEKRLCSRHQDRNIFIIRRNTFRIFDVQVGSRRREMVRNRFQVEIFSLDSSSSSVWRFFFYSVSLIFPSAGYRNKEGGGAAQWPTNRFNFKQRSIRSERENA